MTEERQLTIADVGAMPAEIAFSGEIHPVADLFPMMTDDELNDLAEDIKANGLIHPIVLDSEGRLVDGRNRLAGCQRARIEPTYERLKGHDPVSFILSCNVARRHLTKGQQAMAVARARQLSTKFTSRSAAQSIGVSHQRIHQASAVLDYAPDLSDAVLSGAKPLNEAYEEAKRRKEASQSREAQLERIQSKDPELWTLVQEERIKLSEAIAILEKREKEDRDYTAQVSRMLDAALLTLDPGNVEPEQSARNWLKADPKLIGSHADFSAQRARRAADILRRYADLKENENNV
jgi:hypothetical protein